MTIVVIFMFLRKVVGIYVRLQKYGLRKTARNV